jgi:hypothetical protein
LPICNEARRSPLVLPESSRFAACYTKIMDTPYAIGHFLGPFVFVAMVWGIGYLGIRVFKKRKPNAHETKTLIIVGVVLAILGVIGQLVNRSTGNY